MSIDTIGNFLTIIRNGILASKRKVSAPYSKMNYVIAKILKDEGFIKDLIVHDPDSKNNKNKQLEILLKYVNGESVIHEIKRISKPSRRTYEKFTKIKPVIGGLGISILSTNRGIITNKEAKKFSVGGEIICTVW